MRECIQIHVAKPESDLASYSSVRVNPITCYRVDTTLEKFCSALDAFQKETGLQVLSIERFNIASVPDFSTAMQITKLVQFLADTMPEGGQ